MRSLISRKNFLLFTGSSAASSVFGIACGTEDPSTRANTSGGGAGTAGSSSGGAAGGSASGGSAGKAGSTAGGSAGTGGGTGGAGGSGGTSGGSGGAAAGSSGSAGSGGSAGGGESSCLAAVVADISCPHDQPHELTVPLADIMTGAAMQYDIQGQADHSHTISLSPADFATLKAGGTVYKFVEADQYQDHCVTLSCATAGDPEASGMCDLGNAFVCS